uniref:uncharacterized protein LOC122588200 n=1 Tax=Erigeron canadensis TaxID=72917 RepID=UPI001CB8D54F|nr:uncharacterized protein LOC122588200 [Erigeron canadensis]
MSSSSESRCVFVGSDSSSKSDGMFLHNALQWMEDTASSNAVQNRQTVERQRENGHQILLNDWFVDEPKYDDAYFQKKFRMEKSMFLKIVDNIEAKFPDFRDGFDARGQGIFKPLQKVASAVRQLATGNPPDEYDEYLHMATRTGHDFLDQFCDAIIKLYGPCPYPTDPKEERFKKLQEGARKDVERAFGVPKGKWKILRRPLRPLIKHKIGQYVYATCILHNMVIKGDGRAISPVHIMDQPVQPVWDETFLAELLNEDIHHHLRYDLIEHVEAQDLGHLDD